MKPVLQTVLPHTPWSDPVQSRLPGIQPLPPDRWLVVDDAFAGQMSEKDRLLSARRDDVFMQDASAEDAAAELLGTVLHHLQGVPGYQVCADEVQRPDGVRVAIDASQPLITAARLVQEDLCILQKMEDQHVLTAAALCFPASWTLGEKFMRPLQAIHGVVADYDANIARRVQRLFDAIHPDRPMWRANYVFYDEPTLFAPRAETDQRPPVSIPSVYVRSERQTLLKLPVTGAVVFSIHTYMVRWQSLTKAQATSLLGSVTRG